MRRLALVLILTLVSAPALAQTQTFVADKIRIGPTTVPAQTAEATFGVDDANYCTLDIGATGAATWNCTGSGAAFTFSDAVTFSAAVTASTTLGVTGNTTLTGDLAVNGGDLTSTAPLNITPTGLLTLNPTTDIELNPTGNDVLPTNNYDINLGSLTKKFQSLFASELLVETLVAADVMATVGGRVLVGPTTVLTSDLAAVGGGGSGDGLTGTYWAALSGTSPNVTYSGESCGTNTTTTINWNGTGSLHACVSDNESFYARWDGYIKPGYTESYTFYCESDDGCRIFLDTGGGLTERTSGSWVDRAQTESATGSISLTANTLYAIRVEYYEQTGSQAMYFRWYSASTTKAIVPQSALYTTNPNTSTIATKHNNLASGDFVYLEKSGQVEWLKVTSAASGGGPYSYSVERDKDGTGSNDWLAGDAVFSTGNAANEGWIDLFANTGMRGGTAGPTIVGHVRTGTSAYTDTEPRWVLGNLDGFYGKSGTVWGVAFGDPTDINILINTVDGIRLRDSTTDRFWVDTDGYVWISAEDHASTVQENSKLRWNIPTGVGSLFIGARYSDANNAVAGRWDAISNSSATNDIASIVLAAETQTSGGATEQASLSVQASETSGSEIQLVADVTSTSGPIKERSRTTAMGEWIAVSYDGGNFNASDGGAWSVASGDVALNRYMLVGKTLTWAFRFKDTDVTTATPVWLKATIPGGFEAAQTTMACAIRVRNAGTWASALGFGYVDGAGGDTTDDFVWIARDGAGTVWSTGTSNNTEVLGTCTFEVQ